MTLKIYVLYRGSDFNFTELDELVVLAENEGQAIRLANEAHPDLNGWKAGEVIPKEARIISESFKGES